MTWPLLNSLTNDKILDLSKFKAFADDNLDVNQKLKFAFGRVKKIVGKGENAGYQHFLLFPTMFGKLSFSGSLKVMIVWLRVKWSFHVDGKNPRRLLQFQVNCWEKTYLFNGQCRSKICQHILIFIYTVQNMLNPA